MKLPSLVLLTVLAACRAGSDDVQDSDESSGTTSEPTPPPAFLNPALGSFRIDTTQLEPELLVVQNIDPGVTQVLIDELASAGLGANSPFGELTEDSLTLQVRGALVSGEHDLQLLTPSKDGPRYSVRLTMQLQPPDPAQRPIFGAELAAEPIAIGDTLLASGGEASGLLGVIGHSDAGPTLRLFPADTDGWSTADSIVIPLTGHVPEAMSLNPAVSAIVLPEGDGSPRRLRVAYTVGLPAAAIVTRDITVDPDPIAHDPVTAFDLTAALAGAPVEWATFERPALLGQTVLAELHAAADAEQPHPGDRRLVASFWRGEALGWAPPQHIGTATPTDLDSLGPAPVLWDISGSASPSLSLRTGGAFPAVLTVNDKGALSITTPPLNAPLDVRGEIAMTTLISDFGSRTVAAVDPQGRVSLTLLDTSRGNAPRRISPKTAQLGDAAVTGPLAAGVGRGFPFFLVPHGEAAPVTVVVSDGAESFVRALADLHCDALTLAVTLAGNDPELAAVPLACLLNGELRLGRVTIAAPG